MVANNETCGAGTPHVPDYVQFNTDANGAKYIASWSGLPAASADPFDPVAELAALDRAVEAMGPIAQTEAALGLRMFRASLAKLTRLPTAAEREAALPEFVTEQVMWLEVAAARVGLAGRVVA